MDDREKKIAAHVARLLSVDVSAVFLDGCGDVDVFVVRIGGGSLVFCPIIHTENPVYAELN